MDRQPTIKDVAARAGVSFKTVSRVLNGEPHVREPIRDAVLAAAADLGYRPNMAARALIGAPSRLIAFLYDNPNYSYVTEAELGALIRCLQSGYHMAIEPIDLAAGPGAQVEQILASLRPDGLILSPPVCDDGEVLAAIERARVRAVRIAPSSERAGMASVRIDDREGARVMAERLLRLGHRRIAFVKGHPGHSAAVLRLEGFLSALAAHGVRTRPEDIIDGDFTFEAGLRAGRRLLASPDRPTAVFAGNDMMALGVMAAAREAAVAIPGGLSVAGFDDLRGARTCWPELTTVRQPITEMYSAAAGMIIAAAGGDNAAWRSVAMPTQLMERGSTAAP